MAAGREGRTCRWRRRTLRPNPRILARQERTRRDPPAPTRHVPQADPAPLPRPPGPLGPDRQEPRRLGPRKTQAPAARRAMPIKMAVPSLGADGGAGDSRVARGLLRELIDPVDVVNREVPPPRGAQESEVYGAAELRQGQR